MERIAPLLEPRKHRRERRVHLFELACFLLLGETEPGPLLLQSLLGASQLFETAPETDALRAGVLELLEQAGAPLAEHRHLVQEGRSPRLALVQLSLGQPDFGLALQEIQLELLQLGLVPRENGGQRGPALLGLGVLLVERPAGARQPLVLLLREPQVEPLDLLAETAEAACLPDL